MKNFENCCCEKWLFRVATWQVFEASMSFGNIALWIDGFLASAISICTPIPMVF